MSKLPHEIITELEDKARLFDRLVRAHKQKMFVLSNPHTHAAGAINLFTVEVNKIMRDAEQYGFLDGEQIETNQSNVKQN